MFLYYVYSSGSNSPLGSISESSSQSSLDYSGYILSEEELQDPAMWQEIKKNFLEYDLSDQQKILQKAIEQGEKAFVLRHFFDDDQYDFSEIFMVASGFNEENLIEGIIKGWLDRSNWAKLTQHFASFGEASKRTIWNKAIEVENREFLKRYWDEMCSFTPQSVQREPIRRERDSASEEAPLSPPLPQCASGEVQIPVSQYKKERRAALGQ